VTPEHAKGYDVKRTDPMNCRQVRAKPGVQGRRVGGRSLLFVLIGVLCVPFLIAGKQTGDAEAQKAAVNEGQTSGEQVLPVNQLVVEQGNEFSLTLKSNASTGFQWRLAAPLDESILKLVGSEYKASSGRRIGEGGTEVWTFQAVGVGTTSIRLEYLRSWEKGVPPARTAVYSVVVK